MTSAKFTLSPSLYHLPPLVCKNIDVIENISHAKLTKYNWFPVYISIYDVTTCIIISLTITLLTWNFALEKILIVIRRLRFHVNSNFIVTKGNKTEIDYILILFIHGDCRLRWKEISKVRLRVARVYEKNVRSSSTPRNNCSCRQKYFLMIRSCLSKPNLCFA